MILREQKEERKMGELLRLVYRHDYVIQKINEKVKNGPVKKIKMVRSDRVEYYNKNDGCIAVAVEESRYDSYPVVVVREYFGPDLCKAVVCTNFSGRPNVDFYANVTDCTQGPFFDEKLLDVMHPSRGKKPGGGTGGTSGGSGKGSNSGGKGSNDGGKGSNDGGKGGNGGNPGGNGGSGGEGGEGGGGGGGGGKNDDPGEGCLVWFVILVCVFACGFVGYFFERLDGCYYLAYDILEMVRFAVTKLTCPIVLVLCLLFVPCPKGKGTGAVTLYVILVLLTAAACVPVGIQLDRMLQPFGLGIQGWNNVKFFAMSLLPGFVYYMVCFAMMKLTKKSRHHSDFRWQCWKAATVYYWVTSVSIFAARMIAAYTWQYTPYKGGGFYFMIRVAWYMLLVGFLSLGIISDFKKAA